MQREGIYAGEILSSKRQDLLRNFIWRRASAKICLIIALSNSHGDVVDPCTEAAVLPLSF